MFFYTYIGKKLNYIGDKMNNESISFSMPSLAVNIKSLSFYDNLLYRDTHYHNEIELIRVDEGEIVCHISDKRIIIPKGKIVFINSKTIHRLTYHKSPAVCTYMQIDIGKYARLIMPYLDRPFYSFINQDDIIPYAIFDDNSEIGEIFKDIKRESLEKKPHFDIYIKAKIFNITAFMCRSSMLPKALSSSEKKLIKKIMPAIEYVEENYSGKIYLDELCKELGINKFYFCKLFKQAVGANFSDYVNYHRLWQAVNLLSDSDMNISEIAFLTGFNSIQYFNKAFKKYKGCTPREFRNLNKKSIV